MNLANIIPSTFKPTFAPAASSGSSDALVAKPFSSNLSFNQGDEGIAFTLKRRGVAATRA